MRHTLTRLFALLACSSAVLCLLSVLVAFVWFTITRTVSPALNALDMLGVYCAMVAIGCWIAAVTFHKRAPKRWAREHA